MSLQLYDIEGRLQNWPDSDRAWQFGDGVFRTALVRQGQVRDLVGQLTHLLGDARRLRLDPLPDLDQLMEATSAVTRGQACARLKWVISAGDSSAGYVRAGPPRAMLALLPLPKDYRPLGQMQAWICSTRLSHSENTRGAKSLNRLDQVLARTEQDPHQWPEGLMCDREGHLASGISSNLFWADPQGRLSTHPLDDCGVRGRTRARILALAEAAGQPVMQRSATPAEVFQEAAEILLCNSLWGVASVTSVADWSAQSEQFAKALRDALHQEDVA